jgi:hypothetical protein
LDPTIVITLGALPFLTVTVPAVHEPFGNPSPPPVEKPPVQDPYVRVETLTVTDLNTTLILAVTLPLCALRADPVSSAAATTAATSQPTVCIHRDLR